MKSVDLAKGNLSKHLFYLAFPMAIGIVANMSFNIVDTYFIGKLGINQLTAISFSFPVIMTVLNLSIGFAIGINSVLSRLIGSEKDSHIKGLSTTVVILVSFISLMLTILGILTINPLFKLLGANQEHLKYINQYMTYAYVAMGLRMISISISGTFRAHGVTKVPSMAIVTTSIINAILDPILIFGIDGFVPKLGIEGAGIATMISNLCALAVESFFAIKVYNFFGKPFVVFDGFKKKLLEIGKIASISSIGNALNPISISVANFYLSKYQINSVAGFGVASKIQAFSMIPVLALSAATGPVVGQNFGQNNFKRVIETLKKVSLFALIWGVIQVLFLSLFSETISEVFTDNETAINFSKDYLFIVSMSLFGYAWVILSSSILNAINKAGFSFLSIFLRTIFFFLVFLYFFRVFGIDNFVVWAFFVSNILAGFISIFIAKKLISNNQDKK